MSEDCAACAWGIDLEHIDGCECAARIRALEATIVSLERQVPHGGIVSALEKRIREEEARVKELDASNDSRSVALFEMAEEVGKATARAEKAEAELAARFCPDCNFLHPEHGRAAGRESGRGGTETSGREPAQDTGAAAKSAAHIESGEALERRGWDAAAKSAARRSAVPPPRER